MTPQINEVLFFSKFIEYSKLELEIKILWIELMNSYVAVLSTAAVSNKKNKKTQISTKRRNIGTSAL